MAKAGVVLMCLLVGCAHVDTAALIASTASLACDWGQTRSAADRGWASRIERNPILGPRPSTSQVDMYFGVTALLNVTLWTLLPKGWKSIVPAGVTAMEANTVYGNRDTTVAKCGLFR